MTNGSRQAEALGPQLSNCVSRCYRHLQVVSNQTIIYIEQAAIYATDSPIGAMKCRKVI